jgi:NAD(P)-dependent dehydrogenase (short-subunit alcohol dehydrogenase family)
MKDRSGGDAAGPRTALVTGAGSGIGRAFAETLAGRGHALVLLDVDDAGLSATVSLVEAAGASARSAVVDVANRPWLEGTVKTLAPAEAGLDLVIHCAAVLGAGTFAEQPPEEFERVLQVDLVGTANVVRATLPWLRRARGQLVALASTAAVHGWPGLAAYSAAKFAVTGYCEAIRPELAADGVGVTVVFPLLIDTPLLDRPGLPPILRRGRRIPAATVVRKTLRAAARRRRRVYVPAIVRALAALEGVAPSLLDWYGARFGVERG